MAAGDVSARESRHGGVSGEANAGQVHNLLNKGKTQMNILLGLCVGHDMLFTKYSEAPVTTLVAKDRVLAHNPVAALTNRYYRRKFLGS